MNKPKAALFVGTVKEVHPDSLVVTYPDNDKGQTVRIGGTTVRAFARTVQVGDRIGFDDFLVPFTLRRIKE